METQHDNQLSINFDITSIPSRENIHFAELRVWKFVVNDSQLISLMTNKSISGQCLVLILYAAQTRENAVGGTKNVVVS